MKDDGSSKLIKEFNQLLKKMDNVYDKLAKSSGISDTAFWIIYTIKNEKETYKQKDLCVMWSYSKQTINSALKKLEEQNIIKLVSLPENKKDKKIILTDYGEQIAKELIDPVNEIEKESLKQLKEANIFIDLFKKYIETMEEKSENFLKKQDRRNNENDF